jgi:hypothetical protein
MGKVLSHILSRSTNLFYLFMLRNALPIQPSFLSEEATIFFDADARVAA